MAAYRFFASPAAWCAPRLDRAAVKTGSRRRPVVVQLGEIPIRVREPALVDRGPGGEHHAPYEFFHARLQSRRRCAGLTGLIQIIVGVVVARVEQMILL
jgi:hypothetical protein